MPVFTGGQEKRAGARMSHNWSIAVLALCAFLAGCAGASEEVSLEYVPFAKDRGLKPNFMQVTVTATDNRTAVGSKVSAAINAIGIETNAINSDKSVDLFVRDAIEAELLARGFETGADGARVHIDVVRFYNNFQRGAGSGMAMAQVGFRVTVHDQQDVQIFSTYYDGGASRPVRLANGSNAKSTLEVAFYDAASKLAKDWEFFGSLADANQD